VSAFQVVLVAFLGLISLVGLVYLLVRAGSIGYFRTRNEYERERAHQVNNHEEMLAQVRQLYPHLDDPVGAIPQKTNKMPDEPAQKRHDEETHNGL
jgi:hypothetical protein